MRVVCVILAAGRGTRLGGPKALLAWPRPHGAALPLALVHAGARLGVDCESVVIVTRPKMATILASYHPEGACHFVSSAAPDEQGPAGSLAAAVAHLDAREPALAATDAILVSPVDCLPASPAVVAALRAMLTGSGQRALAVRPRHGSRGGHPVLVRPDVLAPYREASPPPLRDVLRGLGEQLADCQLDDDSVLGDVDTPQDYARYTGDEHGPRFLAEWSSRVDSD